MKKKNAPGCPHCGQPMKKWRVPLNSTWSQDFFYVCFNDVCPYFEEGWEQTWEKQQIKASYRCRMDPDTRACAPLPVWSYNALKEDIIE